MHVWTTSAPPFYKNGYVVACERTRHAIVIDPGDDVSEQLEVVKREAVSVTMILLTHAHLDHVTGVGAAKAALGVPVWLHSDDLFLYERAAEQGRMFGLQVNPQPKPDRFYVEGESLAARTAGSCLWETPCLPGRSAGRICLAATWTRCWRRSATSCSSIPTRQWCTQDTAPTPPSARRDGETHSCIRDDRGTGRFWKTTSEVVSRGRTETTSEVVFLSALGHCERDAADA